MSGLRLSDLNNETTYLLTYFTYTVKYAYFVAFYCFHCEFCFYSPYLSADLFETTKSCHINLEK